MSKKKDDKPKTPKVKKPKEPKAPKEPTVPKADAPGTPIIIPITDPPSFQYDLSHWTLTVPGQTAIVRADDLVAGFQSPKYFHLMSDGSLAFVATTAGFTTANSNYPRSELREQIMPPSNARNWELFGRHELVAECNVVKLSAAKKVIIGQIHSYQGNAYPLVKLFHRNGNIELDVKRGPLDNTDDHYKFAAQPLNQWFDYSIRIRYGVLYVTVNGKEQEVTLNEDWDSNSFYFKAGCYCIDASGHATDYAEVRFNKLEVSHGTQQ